MATKLEEVLNWPSIADVCRTVGVCQNTGYNWVWRKKVDAIQVLGAWRVNPRDVKRMQKQRAERAAKTARKEPADGNE